MTINIRNYAKACNVDLMDMLRALQKDPDARQQFEAWKGNYILDSHEVVMYY